MNRGTFKSRVIKKYNNTTTDSHKPPKNNIIKQTIQSSCAMLDLEFQLGEMSTAVNIFAFNTIVIYIEVMM